SRDRSPLAIRGTPLRALPTERRGTNVRCPAERIADCYTGAAFPAGRSLMMAREALVQSSIPGIPVRHGKVRDVYDFGDRLLIVASDRISAFDWVLPTGIADKGRVLTQLSDMWFDLLGTSHHRLSMNPADVPLPPGVDRDALAGRSMV